MQRTELIDCPTLDRYALASTCALLAICWLMGAAGNASCAAPADARSELLWSYPESGAWDVPVDTRILLRTRNLVVEAMTLDGRHVSFERVGFDGFEVDPGELKPHRVYQLVVYGDRHSDEGALRLRFRTGARSGSEPVSASVRRGRSDAGYPEDLSPPLCAAILAGQDCFDTGQDALLTFEMEESEAIAWRISRVSEGSSPWDRRVRSVALWPAACGDPAVFTHGAALPDACFEVAAIGRGGRQDDGDLWCQRFEPAPGTTRFVWDQHCIGDRRVVHREEPIQPRAVRRAGIRGVVLTRVSVDPSGQVTDVEITKGLPFGLNEIVETSLRNWTFQPIDGSEPTTICLETRFGLDS